MNVSEQSFYKDKNPQADSCEKTTTVLVVSYKTKVGISYQKVHQLLLANFLNILDFILNSKSV